MKKMIVAVIAMMVFVSAWGQLKLSEKELRQLQVEQINSIELKQVKLSYPRQVGKNSRKDIHGYGPSVRICVLRTSGKQGIGEVKGGVNEQKMNSLRTKVVGKKVIELIMF